MTFKHILIGCAFGALSLISAAETDLSASAQQQLKQKLKKLNTFSASFSQVVTDLNGEILQEASGHLTLQQPNQLHWQTQEPDETSLIADGETLWHIDPFVEQVIASDQAQATENNPIILLTNPDSDMWKGFDVATEANTATFVVSSRSGEGQILQLVLSFEGDTLASLKIQDWQQQTSQFTFDNIRQNQTVASETFVFSLPDGFELDDQRGQ